MNKNYTVQELKSLLDKRSSGKINWRDIKSFLIEWALEKEKKGEPEYSLYLTETVKLIEVSETRNKS